MTGSTGATARARRGHRLGASHLLSLDAPVLLVVVVLVVEHRLRHPTNIVAALAVDVRGEPVGCVTRRRLGEDLDHVAPVAKEIRSCVLVPSRLPRPRNRCTHAASDAAAAAVAVVQGTLEAVVEAVVEGARRHTDPVVAVLEVAPVVLQRTRRQNCEVLSRRQHLLQVAMAKAPKSNNVVAST